MAYIIDGHNLIGKMRDISLAAINDEAQLIQRLQEFCRLKQKSVDVYFDGAPPGFGGNQSYGNLKVHYVSKRITADSQIIRRLRKSGKAARNWTVVTSDRQIQAEAHALHATVITSEEFSKQLELVLSAGDSKGGFKPEMELSAEEVDEWLRLFKSHKK